ncbi:MAG: FkbM family methyltransferase, partial [Planctomycetales bacterium]
QRKGLQRELSGINQGMTRELRETKRELLEVKRELLETKRELLESNRELRQDVQGAKEALRQTGEELKQAVGNVARLATDLTRMQTLHTNKLDELEFGDPAANLATGDVAPKTQVKTVSTRQGIFTLPINTPDVISNSLLNRGDFQLDLVKDAISFFRETNRLPARGQGTVVDIGANNGVISIGLLLDGEFDKAITVEPDPKNFAYLRRNIYNNQLQEKFFCFNQAASDEAGVLDFELSDRNYGDHRVRSKNAPGNIPDRMDESTRPVIQVQASTVDQLINSAAEAFTKDVAIAWVDVQGYEGYVFRGAAELFARDIPVVSEIWPYGIRRTGMTPDAFCDVVRRIWSSYWMREDGKFTRFSTNEFNRVFEKIGFDGEHDDVIFTL